MGASRSVVLVVLLFPAGAGVVSLLSEMTASRARSQYYATTSDYGVAVATKIIRMKMEHSVLHLIDDEYQVSVHHHLNVLVLRGESLYTDILELAVKNHLAYLLELRARERLLHKV